MDVWSGSNISSKSIYRYNQVIKDYKPISTSEYSYKKYNSINIPQSSIYRALEFPGEINGWGPGPGNMTKLVTNNPPSTSSNPHCS